MNIRKFMAHFGFAFAVTFLINIVVVFLWDLIRHGQGTLEWETAFFFAITVGLVLPLSDAWQDKKKG